MDILEHVDRFGPDNPLPRDVRAFLKLDGSGSDSVVGTWTAVAPGLFWWECPAGAVAFLSELIVWVYDETVTWAANKYGAIAKLANGIQLQVQRYDGAAWQVVHDLLGGVPVTCNTDLEQHVHHLRYVSWAGNPQSLSAMFALNGSGGPTVLEAGDRIVLTARDDLAALDGHTWKVVGKLYSDRTTYIQPPPPVVPHPAP